MMASIPESYQYMKSIYNKNILNLLLELEEQWSIWHNISHSKVLINVRLKIYTTNIYSGVKKIHLTEI